MAKTSISNSTSYTTIATLKNFRDWRQIADWLSTSDARGNESAFNSSTVVQKHLNAASGLLEAACLKGGRYTSADLVALAGVSADLRDQIVSWVAIGSMSRFKTRTAGDDKEIGRAEALLEALANGDRIFSLQETADAGLPDTQEFAPAGSEAEDRRPSVEAARFFGRRTTRGGT